jgi:hypothetical protein
MTHPRCSRLIFLLLAGACLVLALSCKQKPGSPPPTKPTQPPPPASAPQSRPAQPTADATAAKPLALRRLTVRSGFERAEVIERKNEQEAHWGKVPAVRSWAVRSEDQVWTRVIEIQLGDRSPRSLSGYLPRWLKSHGCTAKEVVDLPPLKQGSRTPPQLTFSGSCKGGERYLKRVLLLGDTAYELHVDASPLVKAARLREALLALFARLELGG